MIKLTLDDSELHVLKNALLLQIDECKDKSREAPYTISNHLLGLAIKCRAVLNKIEGIENDEFKN